MVFKGATETSILLFLFIVLAVLALETMGVYFAYRKSKVKPALAAAVFLLANVVWIYIISQIVKSNVIAATPMPLLPLFMFGNLALAALFAFSPVGTRLAQLPLPALVFFQAFRLPLELILHEWSDQGVIPETMTWTGSNWDIGAGAAALLAAPFARNIKVAWGFNILGSILLLNVGRVVIMSSPLPFAWDVQPLLQLGFFVPYVWILPVCVCGALAGHIILTRALLAKR